MSKKSRPVYPWHWPTLKAVYQWLNSYLGHFCRASSYRLVERLWQRFPWLSEYFRRDGWRVIYTFTPPRPAFRLAEQRFQFCDRLPDHILVVQLGKWREVWGDVPQNLLPRNLRRFPESCLPALKERLWQSGLPIAWIAETGRRITAIAERTLVCRWADTTTD